MSIKAIDKIKILALDSNYDFHEGIKSCVDFYFKDLELICNLASPQTLWEQIVLSSPDIVIINIRKSSINNILPKIDQSQKYEWIIHCQDYKMAAEAFYYNISGFFTYPINNNELRFAISQSVKTIIRKRTAIHSRDNFNDKKNLLYIPTAEGAELIRNEDIIRCEGKERCTKIISTGRSVIISSYNIGHFTKLLTSPIFISTHKSHIVNYLHIKRYLREGILQMSDQSSVPISRRKRTEILEVLKNNTMPLDL